MGDEHSHSHHRICRRLVKQPRTGWMEWLRSGTTQATKVPSPTNGVDRGVAHPLTGPLFRGIQCLLKTL